MKKTLSKIPTYNWKNKTFLVVEDDFASKFYLDEILEDTQVNLIYAIDGKEAIDLCKNNDEIDLILMDILLPEVDGYAATRKIKSIKKDVPIIAQTAYSLTNDKEKCLRAGCDDFIHKPLDTNELFDVIARNMK